MRFLYLLRQQMASFAYTLPRPRRKQALLIPSTLPQTGFAPIALVVLLLFGIAAGTILVQNGVNFLPKAQQAEESRPLKPSYNQKADPICTALGSNAHYCSFPKGWSCANNIVGGCVPWTNWGNPTCPTDYPNRGKDWGQDDSCFNTLCDYPDFTELRKDQNGNGRCYKPTTSSNPGAVNPNSCRLEDKVFNLKRGILSKWDFSTGTTRIMCDTNWKAVWYTCKEDGTIGFQYDSNWQPQCNETKRIYTRNCIDDESLQCEQWGYSGGCVGYTEGDYDCMLSPDQKNQCLMSCDEGFECKINGVWNDCVEKTSTGPAAQPAAPQPAAPAAQPPAQPAAPQPAAPAAQPPAQPAAPQPAAPATGDKPPDAVRDCKGDELLINRKDQNSGRKCAEGTKCVIDSLETRTCLPNNFPSEGQPCPEEITEKCGLYDGKNKQCLVIGGLPKCRYPDETENKDGKSGCKGTDLNACFTGEECWIYNDTSKGTYKFSACKIKSGPAPAPAAQPPARAPGAAPPAQAPGAARPPAGNQGAPPGPQTIVPEVFCGKDKDGLNIPCYAIGVFGKEELTQRETQAKIASVNYALFRKILDDEKQRIDGTIADNAKKKIAAAEEAMKACLIR